MKKLEESNSIVTRTFESDLDNLNCVVKQLLPREKLADEVVHILFSHGALEYGQRHIPLFNYLRDHFGNKLVISYYDLIGHGESSGSRAYVDKFETYVNDYLKFTRSTLDIYHEKKVKTYIISHSLGGMIALSAISSKKFKFPFQINGLIMSNPCVKAKLILPELVVKLVGSMSQYLGKTRITNPNTGSNLTSDKERSIAFNSDPLISKFITVSMALAINNNSSNLFNESYYIDVPLLFQISGDDDIVSSEATLSFIKGIKKDLVQVTYYNEAKHDLYNETCRKEAFQEIIEYIEKS